MDKRSFQGEVAYPRYLVSWKAVRNLKKVRPKATEKNGMQSKASEQGNASFMHPPPPPPSAKFSLIEMM